MKKEEEGQEGDLSFDDSRDMEWDKLDQEESGQQREEKIIEAGLPDEDPAKFDFDSSPAPKDSGELNKAAEQHHEDANAKALRDTKAWATKLSQENAELRKLIAEGATAREIKEAQKSRDETAGLKPEALDGVFMEYPELKEVLLPLIGDLTALKAETERFKQENERRSLSEQEEAKRRQKEAFEREVLPKVMTGEGGHPDFMEIIATEEYFTWAKSQRPGLRTAALESGDPDDIRWALSEYKKTKARPAAAELRQQEAAKKAEKLKNQMTLRGGSSQFIPPNSGQFNSNDYDAAWAKAEREESRR